MQGAIEFECPKCGAKVGDRCKNYKGKGKQPCPERLVAAGLVPAKPSKRQRRAGGPGKAWQQAELFPHGQEGDNPERW